MTAWTTEQRVAVALWGEHEPTHDLARWARGETAPRPERTVGPWSRITCDACGCDYQATRFRALTRSAFLCDRCDALGLQGWVPTSVPDPLDVEAYRADCARRGVEPGPLPSLAYVDDRVEWGWFGSGRQRHVYVRVAGLTCEAWKLAWDVRGCGSPDDLILLARLAKAAAEAMR